MDYLRLFNEIIKVARPVNASEAKATSLEQGLKDTGLDSLDLLMVGVFLSEIFGVDEETAKKGQYSTVGEMVDYFVTYATKTPESVESAVEGIQ